MIKTFSNKAIEFAEKFATDNNCHGNIFYENIDGIGYEFNGEQYMLFYNGNEWSWDEFINEENE